MNKGLLDRGRVERDARVRVRDESPAFSGDALQPTHHARPRPDPDRLSILSSTTSVLMSAVVMSSTTLIYSRILPTAFASARTRSVCPSLTLASPLSWCPSSLPSPACIYSRRRPQRPEQISRSVLQINRSFFRGADPG